MKKSPEVLDNEGSIALQPNQSAVVFDADGNATLYFPKAEHDDFVNDGSVALLRVAVLIGESPTGELMRTMANAHIGKAREKAEAEQNS